MAVKQLPKLSELPEPPDRLVGDQERFDVLTFNSLKAQKKMVNDDLNKTFIPKLNEFAVDVNASVDAAAQSERNAAAAATTAGNKANEAASSATTAGTKAGEASKSAAAAKTSETNAAASKTAAAKSATDAQAAQRGAEAARDEAQDLANVGYASDAKAGLAKVDGKTMQADAGGMITAKDVAIGGDKTDLASDRGQIGNIPTTRIADFNTFLESGVYRATWGGDNPGLNTPPGTVNGMVYVASWKNAVGEIMECRQIVYRLGTPGSNDWNIFTREMMSGGTWSPWRWMLTDISLGDGLRFTSGKFSVPEYDGATSSADGVSGLVPAATSAQADHALTGDGTWKSFLSTNGGTVSGAVTATGGFKGKADTATKLATARTIDGVSFNGSANITHYGSCATEAATAAKVVACTGFALATGSRITVRFTVTNTSASPTLNVNGTGAKALRYRNAAISAGYLAANRTYEFVYDGTYYQLVGDIDTNTTYAVATQAKNGLLAAADKKALDYCEAFRLSMIGVPRYWRSTTLPANHVWANGDLVLFADWPELKKVYDAGGFNGMLLAYNANAATIAANLGKWRPNAANPTGLYVPKLGDQFFRAWAGGSRAAGSTQSDAIRNIIGSVWDFPITTPEQGAVYGAFVHPANNESQLFRVNDSALIEIGAGDGVTFDASRVVPTSNENRPINTALPVVLYLGQCI